MLKLYFLVDSENLIVKVESEKIEQFDDIHFTVEELEIAESESFTENPEDYKQRYLNLDFRHLHYHF